MSSNYVNSIARLQNILNELREKCPWDKKQTMLSLRNQTIEEVYELADAISEADSKHIKEELGDVLLHILFYSKIAQEDGSFSFADVIEHVCNKLVRRHPHIYSSVKVTNEEEVKKNWEQLKLKEGKKSVLSGVPTSLPGMVKALRLQDKTKQVGFEWEHIAQVKDKVEEEWQELDAAITSENKAHIEEELGDMFFALINYARFLNIDPELALEKTNKKFIHRFTKIEEHAVQIGKELKELSLEEMDAIWNHAKNKK